MACRPAPDVVFDADCLPSQGGEQRSSQNAHVKGNDVVTSEPGREVTETRPTPDPRRRPGDFPELLRCLLGSPQEQTEFVSPDCLHIGPLSKDEGAPDSRSTRFVSLASWCLLRTSFGITIWSLLDTFMMCTSS